MESTHTPLGFWLLVLIILLLISSFFSSAETGMMALNRYRMRHKARMGHKGAKRVIQLLQRTDLLLSAILIGNNFVNILASAIATTIALHIWGDAGIFVVTLVLTVVVLIFGEVTPKMLASMYPEKIALSASFFLYILMKLFKPITIMTNAISKALICAMGIKNTQSTQDLNQEELKTLVHESDNLSNKSQGMLLGILDLDSVEVDHIMLPRNDIVGINLEEDIEDIRILIQTVEHTRLPVYEGDINRVVGFLHMRNITRILSHEKLTKQRIRKDMETPYYIPEGTPLHTQLYNFQKEKKRLAMVVDEYGDIQGLITLEDILEEIVGKFTTDVDEGKHEITRLSDGSFLINGMTNVWDINKNLTWDLPIDGPKTLNGLITEILEEIPENRACVVIDHYCFEIISLSENKVERVRALKKIPPT